MQSCTPLLGRFFRGKKTTTSILDHSPLCKSFAVARMPAGHNIFLVLYLSRYILTDKHVGFTKSRIGKTAHIQVKWKCCEERKMHFSMPRVITLTKPYKAQKSYSSSFLKWQWSCLAAIAIMTQAHPSLTVSLQSSLFKSLNLRKWRFLLKTG